MKLRVSNEAIKAVIKPYEFNMVDILSITPRIHVGKFKGCALNLVYNKTLIITNGIILMYNNLNDFLSGFEPVSLVKDDSIYYDQEMGDIDFKIYPEINEGADSSEFQPIRELMFGARDAEQAELENSPTYVEDKSQPDMS